MLTCDCSDACSIYAAAEKCLDYKAILAAANVMRKASYLKSLRWSMRLEVDSQVWGRVAPTLVRHARAFVGVAGLARLCLCWITPGCWQRIQTSRLAKRRRTVAAVCFGARSAISRCAAVVTSVTLLHAGSTLCTSNNMHDPLSHSRALIPAAVGLDCASD
jgi:hypothetical protein